METTEKKKKDEKLLINLLCIVTPLLVIGLWMILAPGKPEHQEIEKGTVYILKEAWGIPAGITITVFGLFVLVLTLIRRNKLPKVRPKTMSYQIWFLSFNITVYVLVIYLIVLVQYLLALYGAIPADCGFADMGTLHMIFITFIFCFGIIALISGLVSRAGRKKQKAGM